MKIDWMVYPTIFLGKIKIIVVLKEWKIWKFSNTKMTKPTDKDELDEFESP